MHTVFPLGCYLAITVTVGVAARNLISDTVTVVVQHRKTIMNDNILIAYDSIQEHTQILHNVTEHDTFHNIDASHQSKPSNFGWFLDDS